MSSPPFLAVRAVNGTNAKVGRLLQGWNFTQVGGDVGAGNMEAPAYNGCTPKNRAVEFGGDLFTWQRDKIYKYDPDIDAWVLQATAASMASTDNYANHTGLYVVDIAGTLNLIGLYGTAAGTSEARFNGTSWTFTSIVGSANNDYDGDVIVFRGALFRGSRNTASIVVYDPELGTYAKIAPGSMVNGHRTVGFVVFDNNLYMVGNKSNTVGDQQAAIWKYAGGGFSLVQSLTAIPYPGYLTYVDLPKFAAFALGGAIYVFGTGSTSPSTSYRQYCLKLTPNGSTFTVADISNPVLPSALRSLIVDNTPTPLWMCTVDNDTDPTNPAVHLWYISHPISGTWVHYKWAGEGLEMEGGENVGAFGLAVVSSPQGCGEYAWSAGSVNVEIINRARGAGGVLYTFRAHGDSVVLYHGAVTGAFLAGELVTGVGSGATATIVRVNIVAQTLEVGNVQGGPFGASEVISTVSGSATTNAPSTGGGANYKAKLFHSVDEQIPTTPSTLTGGVTGGTAIRNGNQVENIIADGVIQYTCLWDFGTDGLGIGDPYSDTIELSPLP